jgi:RNA polymerase sigma-70 factor, ECF subfamily
MATLDPNGTRMFAQQRARLLAIAYNITGSFSDAEDAVQEAWLSWSQADRERVREPVAFLTTVVTRRAIDALRARKRRQEVYVGSWLPEPSFTPLDAHSFERDTVAIAAGTARSAYVTAEHAQALLQQEALERGLALVLETLGPLERTCFVLHEAFGVPHAEIAAMLERTPTAMRKMHSRAQTRVRAHHPRFIADQQQSSEIVQQFGAAAMTGELDRLVALLSEDAAFIADGGGKASAPRHPVLGAERIAKVFASFSQRARADDGLAYQAGLVWQLPALVVWREDPQHPGGWRAETLLVFGVVDDKLHRIYAHRNPEKLVRLRRAVERS